MHLKNMSEYNHKECVKQFGDNLKKIHDMYNEMLPDASKKRLGIPIKKTE